jgi:hypothetical protein
MSSEHEKNELNAVEQTLASFSAAPPRLDRDRLMFLAGQASANLPVAGGPWSAVGRNHWLLPASSATLAATSLALAIALFARPAPQPQVVIRHVPTESMGLAPQPKRAEHDSTSPPRIASVPSMPSSPRSDSYLKNRDLALRMGLDALGAPRPGGSGLPAATYLELLEGLSAPAPSGPPGNPLERSPNM